MTIIGRWRALAALLFAFTLLAVACGSDADTSEAEADAEETATDADASEPEEEAGGQEAEEIVENESVDAQTVTMWYHGAGNETERDLLTNIINDFNASQAECNVVREDFPQEAYNESIIAAALDGSLPDILDVDGPVMPNWAWAGYMQPLDVDPALYADFLPGAIGEWNGEVYSIGLWDAAVGIYARKSVLEANDIRIPSLEDPWDTDEFDAALVTLDASGDFDFAFDPGMAWTGEWYPYAFLPLMVSAGGGMFADDFASAEDVLNGPEAVAFGEYWQSLFERGLAPGTDQDGADRETGFVDGKYAMQWNGNWAALAALEAHGDDMLFLPAPDFGNGPRIGAASWQFGVSATSDAPECANQFISYALDDQYLAAFSDGIGLIPSTPSAAAGTENYAPGGPLEVFFGLSNEQAVLRPPTPAYLNGALAFEKALADIANGADVQGALDAAVDEIEADLEANGGYN
ncbi:MAG: sugar ABC transporter substrate-binding protein [Acidimicrobiales bacterium]